MTINCKTNLKGARTGKMQATEKTCISGNLYSPALSFLTEHSPVLYDATFELLGCTRFQFAQPDEILLH